MVFLGYDFKSEELLDEALTVPSYRMLYPNAKDNQRLEYLGDAVLGLIVAEMLYSRCEQEREGQLTIHRSQIVSTAALCEAAAKVSLASHLKWNTSTGPIPANSKTIADAVEAVLAAAYLDGGLDAARAVFNSLGLSAKASDAEWGGNPKGALQMKSQSMKPPRRPVYETIRVTGKAHAPEFTVKVSVEGVGEAEASAGSRRDAESAAAAKLLKNMI